MPQPIIPDPTVHLLALCPDTEYSKVFLQGMLNRMTVSFHKYGAVADAYPEKVSAVSTARGAMEMYARDGNTEHLMDAANYLMIEFMCPEKEGAHYTPTDSGGSIGRQRKDGRDPQANNS